MDRILVTYGTRPLALRLPKAISADHEWVFATCEEIPFLLSFRFDSIPFALEPTYAHELLKLALDRAADYVLPLSKEEIQVLQNTRTLFEEYGVKLLIPDITDDSKTIVNPPSSLPLRVELDGPDVGLMVEFDESWFRAMIK